jgi:hypothetical protein
LPKVKKVKKSNICIKDLKVESYLLKVISVEFIKVMVELYKGQQILVEQCRCGESHQDLAKEFNKKK